ncbi:MAG: crotonase/enoyl-CoA hydratase family protein [Acidimicrobiales bacterium]
MTVLVERRESVTIVTLNRPERRNALDGPTISGIGQAFTEAEHDPDVGAVILTAAGDRAFCAGMDLRAFADSGTPVGTDGPGLGVLMGRTYPKPVVAAVNGPAVAGGFELVLACDLVVAADHATFGLPEVKRGLVAAGGGVLLLPRRLPLALALEMGLTGDPIDAQRAYALGLVNRVVPAGEVLDVALGLAEVIAANAPMSLRLTKELMLEVSGGNDPVTRQQFADRYAPIFASDDAKEGATAFNERRSPRWTGR